MKQIISILAIFLIILGTVSATNTTTNQSQEIAQLQQQVAGMNTIIVNLSNTIVQLKLNLTNNYKSIYPELNNISSQMISRSYLTNFTKNINTTLANEQSNLQGNFIVLSNQETNTLNNNIAKVNQSIDSFNATVDNMNQRIDKINGTIYTNNAVLVGAINRVNSNSNSGDTNILYIACLAAVIGIIAPYLMIKFLGGSKPDNSN